jgi:hypothetical protein
MVFMDDAPLDENLVRKIVERFKIEPSDQLQAIVDQPEGGAWSPEAMQAARFLLDQRAKGAADEPVCRTTPLESDAQRGKDCWTMAEGDTVLAPSFSVPAGLSWMLFLGRFFGRSETSLGKIGEIRGGAAYIYYFSGRRGWVRFEDLEPATLDVGTRLFCHWRHMSGTILRWRDEDERFYIRYDDGQGEWVKLDMSE